MTTETTPWTCPVCTISVEPAEGWTACPRCRTRLRSDVFAPVVERVQLAPGEGRCAAHPGKDATVACARCGGFACDVCATRLGEDVVCAACFDVQHERGEIGSLVARRFRPDLAAGLLAVCTFIPCVGVFASPVAPLVGIWALWRRRRERHLGWGGPVVALLLGGAYLLYFVGIFGFGMLSAVRRGDV